MPATPLQTTAPGAAATDTKQRLLDAAERLFAERGFEGTSMRAVTQAADTSVSAANYHFGSKEELLAAVVRRRVEPLNARRLDALAQLLAPETVPTLEAIFDAFFRPTFERQAQAHREGRDSFPRQIAARLYSDPPELVQTLKSELFGDVNERFFEAFERALPDAPKVTLRMIQQLSIASVVHVLGGQLDEAIAAELAAGAAPGEPPYEPLLTQLVAHNAAGARALADATETA